ncbi:MAG TPA: rhodanese-like domain-containing protein [Candidatus Angelobacter sp.]
MKYRTRRTFTLPLCLLALVLTGALVVSGQKPQGEDELKPGSPHVMQPEELVKAIQASSGPRPVVLYVGPRVFWAQAHIKGAENMGPASRAESLEKLHTRAASLPKDSLVVIYCGCCPYDHCPNIRPAFQELQKLGLSKTRVLYLPKSFGTDWVEKGYPVEKGE